MPLPIKFTIEFNGGILLSAETVASSDGFCRKGCSSINFPCYRDQIRALLYKLVPLSHIIFFVETIFYRIVRQ